MSRCAMDRRVAVEWCRAGWRMFRVGKGFAHAHVLALILVAVCVLTLRGILRAQDQNTAEIRAVLAPYQSSLRRLSYAELSVTADYEARSDESVKYGKARDAVIYSGQDQYLCRRKGDNLLLSSKETLRDSVRSTLLNSVLVDGGHLYVQHRSDEAGEQLTDFSDMPVTYEGKGVAGVSDAVPVNLVLMRMEDSAVIFGLVGNYHVDNYLSEGSEQRLRREDGLDVVESRSRFGTMTLWLDPQQGSLPRRISVSKSGTDRHSPSIELGEPDRVTGEIQMNGSEFWPTGGIRQVNFTVDFGDYTVTSDGFRIAKSMKVTNELIALTGSTATTTTDVAVTSLLLSPDFTEESFRPLLKIPEGHSVAVRGASHLPFKYVNHQVVPGRGIEPLETPQPYDFNSRRTWVIGLNAILFLAGLVVLAFWIVLHRKSAAGEKNDSKV